MKLKCSGCKEFKPTEYFNKANKTEVHFELPRGAY